MHIEKQGMSKDAAGVPIRDYKDERFVLRHVGSPFGKDG